MDQAARRFGWTVWLGVVLLLFLLVLLFLLGRIKTQSALNAQLPVIGQVGDFTLTNQDGVVTTLADLSNHVWVADIIFTRCAGPCPIMTQQMKSLQDALPADSPAKLVSLTTDPDYDSPEIMKRYGEHFGADFHRWTFLTGAKTQIGALAANGLKLSAVPVNTEDQKSPADLFIHSTIFVVVDKQARLRGVFETEGQGIDWTNVQPHILAAVRHLENQP